MRPPEILRHAVTYRNRWAPHPVKVVALVPTAWYDADRAVRLARFGITLAKGTWAFPDPDTFRLYLFQDGSFVVDPRPPPEDCIRLGVYEDSGLIGGWTRGPQGFSGGWLA